MGECTEPLFLFRSSLSTSPLLFPLLSLSFLSPSLPLPPSLFLPPPKMEEFVARKAQAFTDGADPSLAVRERGREGGREGVIFF